ncbi:MAG: glycosyltransferase [bacterium]|nr:glycosyltransferase [bacterium]
MKVLSIGTDRKLFEEESDVLSRTLEYAKLFDELHVIVFTTKKFKIRNLRFKNGDRKMAISDNCWIYPTCSRNRWFYVFDAIALGVQILSHKSEITNQENGFVVSCQDPFECGLAGARIAKKTGAKLHVQIHTDFLSPYFKKGGFLNMVRLFLAGRVLPKADAIRVVSKRIADSLVFKYKNIKVSKLSILPMFLDEGKIKNAPVTADLHKKYPKFTFIVLVLSRFTKEKNILLAIDAFSRVVLKHPRAGLVIVGSGPQMSFLKAQVARSNLSQNVVFEGWTSDPYSYIKSSDLVLQTSWYEGYGLAVAESLLCGIPVVSTSVGVATELLMDNAYSFVCEPGDAKCLSEKMTAFMEKRTLFGFVVENARRKLQGGLPTKEEYLRKYKNSVFSVFS